MEEKLAEVLATPAFPLEGSADIIFFDISAEHLGTVLSDMKKLGTITGEEGKIRVSS